MAETTPSKVKPDARYPGDVQLVHFSTPRKAARHLNMLKNTIRKHKDTIRNLQKYNKRLQDRVNSIQVLLQHLRDINLLNEETASVIMVSNFVMKINDIANTILNLAYNESDAS